MKILIEILKCWFKKPKHHKHPKKVEKFDDSANDCCIYK